MADRDSRGDGSRNGLRFGRTALVREAALPYGLLDLLVSQACETRLAAIGGIERQLEPLTEALISAIHAAIPGLDKPLRRQALALKRGMYCHRLDLCAEAAIGVFEAAGCEPSAYRGWLAGAAQLAHLLDEARTRFLPDQGEALDSLIRDALANGQFASGMAMTSPGVFARLGDLQRGGKKARHIRTKLMKFVVKATYKSAPLNRLAGVALLVGSDLVSTERLSEMRPNQEFLFARFAGDLSSDTLYRLNSSAEWAGSVCTFYGTKQTRVGTARRSTNSHIRFPDRLALELKKLGPDDTVTAKALMLLVADCGMGEAETVRYVRFMISVGLLLPNMVDGLRLSNDELYRQLEEDGLAEEAQALRQVEAVLIDPDADARQRQEASVRYARSSAGAPSVEGEDGSGAVYETLWQPSPLSGALLDEVRETHFPPFLAALPGFFEVAPVYGRLLRDFKRQFGVGGECENLFQWLRRVDLEGPPEAGMGGGGEVTAPAGLTVYFSLLRPTHPSSRVLIQCQNIHCRIGWQLGRFAYGANEPARRLREALRRDIEGFAAPAKPLTLSADSDLVNIQSNPALFEPVIVSPNQSRPRRRAIMPDRIRARHDPASNRIHLFAGGEEIRPVYSGGMIPDPRFGVPYLITVLSEPFRLRPFAPAPHPPGERAVLRVEPVMIEGVLAARGYWWIPMEIIAPVFEATGFDRFLALRKIWHEQGLSERAFICGYSEVASTAYAKVRPKISQSRWFDVRVEACIEYLATLTEYEWVLLQDCTNMESLTVTKTGNGRVSSVCTEVYFDRVSCSLR